MNWRSLSDMKRVTACLVLVLLIWLVFGQTMGYGFVNYDDDVYVYNNPVVAQGVTVNGLRFAFLHVDVDNWHPLSTISHMVDCDLYGLNAGAHHLTNVLLHSVAALL